MQFAVDMGAGVRPRQSGVISERAQQAAVRVADVVDDDLPLIFKGAGKWDWQKASVRKRIRRSRVLIGTTMTSVPSDGDHLKLSGNDRSPIIIRHTTTRTRETKSTRCLSVAMKSCRSTGQDNGIWPRIRASPWPGSANSVKLVGLP